MIKAYLKPLFYLLRLVKSIATLSLILTSTGLLAQDFIYLRNDSIIKAESISVKEYVIYYRDFKDKTRLKKYVYKYQVDHIDYQNGYREDYSLFEKNPKSTGGSNHIAPRILNKSIVYEHAKKFFIGAATGVTFPRGSYGVNKSFGKSRRRGQANAGSHTDVYGGYYFTPNFALGLKYTSIFNPTEDEGSNSIFIRPNPNQRLLLASVNMNAWNSDGYLLSSTFSFPLEGTLIDLRFNFGIIRSSDPLIELEYFPNRYGINSHQSVPVIGYGFLAGFDFSWSFKVWRGVYVSYQFSYLDGDVDFTTFKYVENGVENFYESPITQWQDFKVFNLSIALRVLF